MTCKTETVVTTVRVHDEETCETARRDWVERITSDFPGTFDLIYVDRGDRLTDEQAGYLLRGDFEAFWLSFEDWEHEAREYGVRYELEELRGRWEDDAPTCPDCGDELCDWGDIEEELRDIIYDSDSGDWVDDMLRNTPDVLAAYRPKTSEHLLDTMRYVTQDEPERLREVLRDSIAALGIEPTDELVGEAEGWIGEGYVTPTLLFKVDLLDVWRGRDVVARKGMIWLGDPFNGDGALIDWEGELSIPRDCIEVDGDTGYSAREVFGL